MRNPLVTHSTRLNGIFLNMLFSICREGKIANTKKLKLVGTKKAKSAVFVKMR